MRSLLILLLLFTISCAKPESNVQDPNAINNGDNKKSKDNTDSPPKDSDEKEEVTPEPNPEEPITGHVVCFLGAENDNKRCLLTTDINEITSKKEYKYRKPSRFLTNPNQYRKPYQVLDLDKIDLLSYVSENFQIGEFLVRFKGQYGILAPILVERLQLIRTALAASININSGYRSPKYNKSVGGANYSRHMYGDAVDMWSEEKSLDELKKECIDKGASFYQVYRSHIHCDWRNEDLDPAFYPPLIDQPLSLSPMAEFKQSSSLNYNSVTNSISVTHPSAEEEHDELRYDWSVVTKFGINKITNYQPELNLDKYKEIMEVHVDVGGSVRVSYQF